MQRVRAILLMLTVLVTGITAIGMEMMPISAPAAMSSDAATHADHHGNIPLDYNHHGGSDDCLYCHLAKAADLPSRPTTVEVHRRPLQQVAGGYSASCHLAAWTTPCQPRAPPRRVAA
ncbi:hypothetical protein SAMN04488020_11652 [Palleronia marisminoris]|uniref:DUF2946 domain-containing protein n=2 Tax=Palleronia marisminoris TaxID=315423 RepID=A0A1Y5TVD4_9RHOB|nr:DUF2946 family protein [Palleronia marisminoris]SFH47980.1 hypothetical protein SAMN04488020_11652 [Palleronia marisminoris]SLN69031.1 hypothetical protein PAM7066_03502 [Palleronia marisminoris]